jgi:hypothetical protein
METKRRIEDSERLKGFRDADGYRVEFSADWDDESPTLFQARPKCDCILCAGAPQ